MDNNISQFPLYCFAPAYIFIQRLTLMFKGAMHGWQLLYFSTQRLQRFLHLHFAYIHIMDCSNLTFCITCRCGLT